MHVDWEGFACRGLGVDVTPSMPGGYLVVERVHETGAISIWNSQNPERWVGLRSDVKSDH